MENKVLGRHYLIDFCNCNKKVLSSVKNIEEIMETASFEGNLHVVQKHFHQFDPYGVSGVIILKESHFTVHTWPEYEYASVDLYLCSNDNDVEKIINYLKSSFETKNTYTKLIKRGLFSTNNSTMKEKVLYKSE